jgi:hypothetical protein
MHEAATSLISMRRHLEHAIDGCVRGWPDWVILTEATAFVAENLAAEAPDRERATALRRIGGMCRGAAASPAMNALPLLRDVVHRVAGLAPWGL